VKDPCNDSYTGASRSWASPSAFLLAGGTRLAVDMTGEPMSAQGLKSAFEKPIL
jgi:hypothetical protein